MARLLSRLVALPVVSLKTGAQVMLIKNLEQGHLVNGTTEDEDHRAVQQCSTRWPLVKFTNGSQRLCILEEFTVNGVRENVEASRTQVPLILAWALSVHKSQGQTLERVRVDLRNTFEKGQVWTRWRSVTSTRQRLWHTLASSSGMRNWTRNHTNDRQIRTNTTSI
ncbi:hypothetical protein EDB85DRAFT_481882 [Lactarius pseudohatsudake]|nr:hypothetical protein EDB85DRAFT_481882 [Lactarius pseudohatsudake]